MIALRRTLAPLITLAVMVTAMEAVVRRLDGYAVLSVKLKAIVSRAAEDGRPDLRHFSHVALASGVDPSWYTVAPSPIARLPFDGAQRVRFDRYPTDRYGAFFAWNPEYVRTQLCAGNLNGSLGILDDFYVYDPVEPGPYPIYRHLPRISPPGWFVTNSFGWRGPDIKLEKPAGTIRIAFVGASTTVSSYDLPFSHPEFIGRWLNLWAASQRLPYRFEVINAGRMGIDSASIAAVVRQELPPVNPDLVIYYEGANQFAPGLTMQMPHASPLRPTLTFRQRTVAEDYSALVRRGLTAVSLIQGSDGYEPRKPDYKTIWPPDTDEEHPDVTHVPLPMGLHNVVANLDSMRVSLGSIGSELAVSSFIWHVYPGMKLDLKRHLLIYRFLNDSYWPASYAHLRRMADFQNRLFQSYAQRYRLPFLDVARDFPPDPDLFSDAVHMNESGLRLQAWVYLQELMPLIQERIATGRWPRRRASNATPLGIADFEAHLVNRSEFLSRCQ